MKPGDRVYVAEVGFGGREGRFVRTCLHPLGGQMVVVRFDGVKCECHRLACSVFKTRAAAEASLIDPAPKVAPARRQSSPRGHGVEAKRRSRPLGEHGGVR